MHWHYGLDVNICYAVVVLKIIGFEGSYLLQSTYLIYVLFILPLSSPVACKSFSSSTEGGIGSGKSQANISSLHAESSTELPNVHHSCHNEGLV